MTRGFSRRDRCNEYFVHNAASLSLDFGTTDEMLSVIDHIDLCQSCKRAFEYFLKEAKILENSMKKGKKTP